MTSIAPLAVIVALGVTQTIGYGSIYYAFGVLTGAMSADTGLSLSWIYGFFSVGQLAGGLLAPFAGRLLDRTDPALVMAAGSLVSALTLAAWTLTSGPIAFGVCVVIGQMASVLVLYEAAFVVAARLAPDSARRTITGITLIAGFASTIFWPLTDWMASLAGWRDIYLAYAALNAFVCAPLHLWLTRTGRRPASDFPKGNRPAAAPRRGRIVDPARRRLAFVILLVAFSASAFVITAIHLHLIGLLGAIGLGGSAAMIGALIGPAQVAGRIVEFWIGDRVDIVHVSVFSATALPLALVALADGAPLAAAAIAFATMFGVGQGLNSIVRGALPLDLFGHDGFGALMGRINAARLLLAATAPFATAALFERFGAETALWSIIAVGMFGALGLAALGPLTRER